MCFNLCKHIQNIIFISSNTYVGRCTYYELYHKCCVSTTFYMQQCRINKECLYLPLVRNIIIVQLLKKSTELRLDIYFYTIFTHMCESKLNTCLNIDFVANLLFYCNILYVVLYFVYKLLVVRALSVCVFNIL